MRTPALIVPAAFHAQQAAEKMVKALLILAEHPLRKTHNVARLLDELGPVPGLPDATRTQLARLTPWAAHTRYPDADAASLPGTNDISGALVAIDHLATLVPAAIDTP